MKNAFFAALAAAITLCLISCEREPLPIHGPEVISLAEELPSSSDTVTITVIQHDTVVVETPSAPDLPGKSVPDDVKPSSFNLLVKAPAGSSLSAVRVDINGQVTVNARERSIGLTPQDVYEFKVEDVSSDNVSVELDYSTYEAKRFAFLLMDYARQITQGSNYAVLVDLTTLTVNVTDAE